MGLGENYGDLLEADFPTGITSGLPVILPQLHETIFPSRKREPRV